MLRQGFDAIDGETKVDVENLLAQMPARNTALLAPLQADFRAPKTIQNHAAVQAWVMELLFQFRRGLLHVPAPLLHEHHRPQAGVGTQVHFLEKLRECAYAHATFPVWSLDV